MFSFVLLLFCSFVVLLFCCSVVLLFCSSALGTGSRNVPPHSYPKPPQPYYLLFYVVVGIDAMLICIAMLNAMPVTLVNKCSCKSSGTTQVNNGKYSNSSGSSINTSSGNRILRTSHNDNDGGNDGVHHSLSVLHLKYTASNKIPSSASSGQRRRNSGQQQLLQAHDEEQPSMSHQPRHYIIDNINLSLTTNKGVHAIMGSSGAGKTTLLDCIAGRKFTGTTSGTITVDGQPLTVSLFFPSPNTFVLLLSFFCPSFVLLLSFFCPFFVLFLSFFCPSFVLFLSYSKYV